MNKWAPFQAVIDGDVLVEMVQNNKNKIQRPILSDDQIKDLEDWVQNSYLNKTNLKFTLYQNGKTNQLVGFVIKINQFEQKITLNSQKTIYFHEIVMINPLDQ